MPLNPHSRLIFALSFSCAAHLLAGICFSTRLAFSSPRTVPYSAKIQVSLKTLQANQDKQEQPDPNENRTASFSTQAITQEIHARSAEASLSENVSPLPQEANQEDLFAPEFGLRAYLPVELLDEKPEIILDIPIDPADLRDFKEGGTAELILWISAAGLVDKVSDEHSTLQEEALERIERHFKAARFKPGKQGGQPVATILPIEVRVLSIEEKSIKKDPIPLKN